MVLTDLRLANIYGVEFLRRIKIIYPDVIRMLLSSITEVSSLLKAVNEGVIYRFLTKPWEPEDLRNQLRDAFQQRDLHRDNKPMR